MSKYVKNLIAEEIASRLEGVDDALLVNVIGMNGNKSVALRKHLREKQINLLVIKNSLARRATEGTPLGAAFEGVDGTNAIVWGGEDIIALAKEITKLADDDAFPNFEARGGVMDGEKLTAERVKEVSKWPGRAELLATIAGQIIGPAMEIASQVTGPATEIAGQVKKLIEDNEKEEGGEEAA